MANKLEDFPEVQGMVQAGMDEAETQRIAQHPYARRFLRDRLDDINTLADPRLQESLRQATEEPETLIDITPLD